MTPISPEGQPAIQDYAKAAISLLDSLNIETTCILGQHTGTMIATELAAAYPDRVDKLILYGPPYFDDQVVQVLQARRPGMTDWQTKDDGSHLKELWDAIKDRAIQQGWPQVPSQLVNRHVLEALKAGEDYSDLGRNAVVNYTRNLDERMKAIQCPTLIIWGTHDILELPKENKAMPGKLIPRNRVVELEGGTYMAMHQMPDKIAQLVLDFLANPGGLAALAGAPTASSKWWLSGLGAGQLSTQSAGPAT